MAIGQQKVPQEIQGRVFSFRRLLLGSMMLPGFLQSGPLTQKLRLPLAEKNIHNRCINWVDRKKSVSRNRNIIAFPEFGTIISIATIYFLLVFRYKQVLIVHSTACKP